MSIVTRFTRLIASDTGDYPLTLVDMPKYAPNTIFPSSVDSDVLIEFGIEVVFPTEPPAGDIVTEGKPELRGGEWYQTWEARSYSEDEVAGKLAERKIALKAAAETARLEAFSKGFPYRFADNTVYHVQVRSSDRGNISDLRTIAKEVLAEGGDDMFPFRVWENVTVPLTAAQMVALADKTFKQVLAGYNVSWAYKDAIDAAETIEALPTPPEEFFTL